jgi:hypothetical protein
LDQAPVTGSFVPEPIVMLPSAVIAPSENPRWAEAARRSTWIEWPPAPAPESFDTATLDGSEDSTVCDVANAVPFFLNASAAVCSAVSLLTTVFSASCSACAFVWRPVIAVVF